MVGGIDGGVAAGLAGLAELAGLPEVAEVRRDGDRVSVHGTGDLLQVVASALARDRITPFELRMDQASLEDAFVSLICRGDDAAVGRAAPTAPTAPTAPNHGYQRADK